MSGRDQRRHHPVESARIVGKAVHQQHRKAGLRPALLVGDLQYAGARAFEHCSPGLRRERGGRRGGGRHEADEETTVDHSGSPVVVARTEDITRVGWAKSPATAEHTCAGIDGDFAHAVTALGPTAWATAKMPLPTLRDHTGLIS